MFSPLCNLHTAILYTSNMQNSLCLIICLLALGSGFCLGAMNSDKYDGPITTNKTIVHDTIHDPTQDISRSAIALCCKADDLWSQGGSTSTSHTDIPTLVKKFRTHVVNVSNHQGDLGFFPPEVKAAPGDLVEYHFYPKVMGSESIWNVTSRTK